MSPDQPLNLAVLGTGFMGRTHLSCYQELLGSDPARADFKIHTICSKDPENELKSGGWGNIDTPSSEQSTLDLNQINLLTDWRDVVNNDDIDAIDICLPTPAHAEIAISALEKGKHVLCEKPLALTSEEARQVTAAAKASDRVFMPAMVMRFWPEWQWLISQINAGELGPVRRAHFVRNSATPPGWYRDEKISGGSLIDLHIHDIDFVYHAFGMPDAVTAIRKTKDQLVDQWIVRYDYEASDKPVSVTAEGGWLGEDYPFAMHFQVDFAEGDISFHIGREQTLLLTKNGKTESILAESLSDLSGYTGEIAYFLDCIRTGKAPAKVTAEDALMGMLIAEAEKQSALTHEPVRLETASAGHNEPLIETAG